MNDLKPYYEQFVNVLPPQQQKIVKHLSLNRGAISGKEIAIACFIEPNVISKQFSLLYNAGMIDKNKSGKDVFYELKEPLMRICFEISEKPDGISSLFVDFLSAYYDGKIIKQQYLMFKYGARFQNNEIKNKYENEALMYNLVLSEPEREKILFAHKVFDRIDNYKELDSIIHSPNTGTLKQIDLSYESFKKGNAFFEENQYEDAIKHYQKAVKLYPENDNLFFLLGLAHVSLGKYEDALKDFQKAAELNQDNELTFHGMGIAFVNLGKYKEAIETYQKAIALNPANDNYFYQIGMAHGNLGKHEVALKNFQKAIELNQENDEAFYGQGIAFENLRKYKEAIEAFKKAIELNPENPLVFHDLGITFSNLKQYDEAIESYRNAIEIDPKDERVYNSLGMSYLRSGKIDSAFKTFQKGMEINPDDININFSLLSAYVRINDHNKSKELIIKLIRKVDNDILTISLIEDVFYNLFRFGSDVFIKSYFSLILKLLLKEKKDKSLWKSLPDSLFNILISIEDYENERLKIIEKTLTETLAEYKESVIPLNMLRVGIGYLKNKEKNDIFKLSKEERKLFKEAVLDKRESISRDN
jgi:tetratricopeptide (TPR) repeat protein